MMKNPNKASSRPSRDSKSKRSFQVPHPLQDLTGVGLRERPIPESVYDRIIERDAKIFERLAKV